MTSPMSDPILSPVEPESAPRPRFRILLLIAYDGSHFSGFQQQNNAPSVATHLDLAIREIDPGASTVVGSSRTDAGVHARLQPVCFTTSQDIRSRGWVLALTSKLPPSISVLRAARVRLDFDPRKHSIWKRYRYQILLGQVEDPFLAGRAWRLGFPLNLERMQREAQSLEGEHDFAAFRSARDPRTSTVRNLRKVQLRLSPENPRCLWIDVEGDRFLYNMVRIIVGTLVDVGRGRIAEGAVHRALASKSRLDLGMTAPAAGLCLEHVELTEWGENPWPSVEEGAPL